MLCKIYSGAPGSGKTLSVLDDVAGTPGRYVIAVPRKELAEEFASYLRERLDTKTLHPIVKTIHSGQAGFREGVVRRIEEALREQGECAHCVVLITHEALLLVSPEKLEGWHLRIDEVPDGAVIADSFSATASFRTLEHFYDLDPTGYGRWYQVVPRPSVGHVKPSEYRADAAASFAAFHKTASNSQRAVFVDLSTWEEASAHGRRVHWWSIWTPASLRSCASISITGAGFYRSILYRACAFVHGSEIVFDTFEPSISALRARPCVTIHYFAQHRGSTAWWATDDGSLCLVRISEYLQRIGFEGYWSSNHDVKAYFVHRFGGDAVEPRQAGTNSLRQHTACAFIYSNKAQAADLSLLEVLNLNEDDVLIAREQEDVFQFVLRGAIRDPSYDGDYDVYLYSRDQAEALRDYLASANITDRVEVQPVAEAGIMDVMRPQRSSGQLRMPAEAEVSVRERKERRQAQERARSQRRRDAKVAERKADGSYRKRGRPKIAEVTQHPTS
ncbi:DEAD/DEAH box helicase family protein [Methylorubrum extorquens]